MQNHQLHKIEILQLREKILKPKFPWVFLPLPFSCSSIFPKFLPPSIFIITNVCRIVRKFKVHIQPLYRLRMHVHTSTRMQGNASKTIRAPDSWLSNGRTLERGWNTNGIGIQRIRASSTECPSDVRGRTLHDTHIPCTDLRYCLPVTWYERLVERCINMWTYKRVRRFLLRPRKKKRTTPMPSPSLTTYCVLQARIRQLR